MIQPPVRMDMRKEGSMGAKSHVTKCGLSALRSASRSPRAEQWGGVKAQRSMDRHARRRGRTEGRCARGSTTSQNWSPECAVGASASGTGLGCTAAPRRGVDQRDGVRAPFARDIDLIALNFSPQAERSRAGGLPARPGPEPPRVQRARSRPSVRPLSAPSRQGAGSIRSRCHCPLGAAPVTG